MNIAAFTVEFFLHAVRLVFVNVSFTSSTVGGRSYLLYPHEGSLSSSICCRSRQYYIVSLEKINDVVP